MTLSDINTKITNLTGADTNTYQNADRLIDINLWYQKVVSMILDSQDENDWDDPNRTDYPIKSIPLTTNRDYQIPASEKMLKLKNLSVSWSGTDVFRATPLDTNEISIPNSTSTDTTANATIDSYYSRSNPRYDVKYNSLFIYPVATAADVTAGGFLLAEWYRQPLEFTLSDLTNGSVSPGFDDTFHAILAYGPAYEYAQGKNLPQLKWIANFLQDYEERLRRQYSSKNLDRKYALQPDYQSMK